jgi:hypothetical protein
MLQSHDMSMNLRSADREGGGEALLAFINSASEGEARYFAQPLGLGR